MGDQLNVLLVDDDQVDVMNVKRAFKKSSVSYPLFVASNGLEALELLRGNSIPSDHRLILLDLNMPKMGGIEFLKELRADPQLRSIPVVVLTTSAEERDKVDAYNLNVAGYIVKPLTFDKFLEIVTTLTDYWSMNEVL